MNTKLCIWFGIISGGFVGILMGLLHGVVCCTPPHPPNWSQLALDGVAVALIAVLIAAGFACLLTHRAIAPVFALALLIGILNGILLGPLAYHLPHPLAALVACALLGLLMGWIVCRFVCSGERSLKPEVSR